MSHIVYGQNKLICFIKLSQDLKNNSDPFLQVNELVLIVYHFQYTCVHYEKVFNHFRHLLPQNATFLQVRFLNNGSELPSDIPLGLLVQTQARLTVTLSEFQLPLPQNIIKQRWKQAFTGINPIRGNYYISRQLGQQGLKRKLLLYFNGQPHNFHREEFEGYQGTNIVVRFMIQGEVIQRKAQTGQTRTVADLIKTELPMLKGKKIRAQSHGVQFDRGMTLKQFLDQWSYNDGFCYLKIDALQ